MPGSQQAAFVGSETASPAPVASLGSQGSSFPLGNLSLHTSLWTEAGLGGRGSQREESAGDGSLLSPLKRKVTVLASEEPPPRSLSSGGCPSWTPFSLLPLLHGAALASGSTSVASTSGESALNAWSAAAAAAAAAAAYASLLPSGRSLHVAAVEAKRRSGESRPLFSQQLEPRSPKSNL